MTTIVNFIQGNFIANPQDKQVEKPVWVLDSADLAANHREIVGSFLLRCKSDKKPLIHIDLGLGSFAKYSNKSSQIVTEQGVHYLKEDIDCPYYLVKTNVRQRKKPSFLPNLLVSINQDVQKNGKLREDKAKCSYIGYEFGLLLEGLETWSLLNKEESHFQKDIESFIAGLVTTNSNVREVVVVTWSPLLSKEVNFHLERTSTCLTKIVSVSNDEWKCRSTVRRYNGFSNQEEYSLRIGESGRVKVIKKKKQVAPERSKDQIQMVNSLGFTVEKDQASRQQQKQLKQLIFPHLKARQLETKECSTKKQCSGNCSCQPQTPENLIILDQEQEDDDDLDV